MRLDLEKPDTHISQKRKKRYSILLKGFEECGVYKCVKKKKRRLGK